MMANDTPLGTPNTAAGDTGETISGESPADRSARMAALARRPRRSKPRFGAPAWKRVLIDMVDGMEQDPLLARYRKELRAELKKVDLSPPPQLIEMAVRCRAVYELVSGAVFSDRAGPVHRRHRRLHQMVEQRRDCQAEYMEMRRRLGLDSESVKHALTFSDAFRQLAVEKDDMPDMAETLRAARERAAASEHRREQEVHERIRKAVSDALAAHGIGEPAEVPLLEGPSEPVPEPVAPLELEPDPAPPAEPAVEDLGNPRAPVVVREQPVPYRAPVAQSRLGFYREGVYCPHPNDADVFRR